MQLGSHFHSLCVPCLKATDILQGQQGYTRFEEVPEAQGQQEEVEDDRRSFGSREGEQLRNGDDRHGLGTVSMGAGTVGGASTQGGGPAQW